MRWSLFVILFLLSISLVNAVKIDEEVEKALLNNSEVEVIVTFNDKSKFLQREFNAGSIISNLDKKEFNGNYFRNSDIAAGKLTKDGLQRLKQNNNVENIYLDYKVHIALNQSIKLIA